MNQNKSFIEVDRTKEVPEHETKDRLRVFYVDNNVILNVLRNWWNVKDTFKVPIIKGVPDDAVVVAVHTDYRTAGVGIVIQSKEFEKVESGKQIPTIGTEYELLDIAKVLMERSKVKGSKVE